MIAIREHIDTNGRSPFGLWLDSLNTQAAVKLTVALERITLGHASAIKAVGEGVMEYKIDFGPGYRIYFGKDGDELVILVAGGTKKRQHFTLKMPKLLGKITNGARDGSYKWR